MEADKWWIGGRNVDGAWRWMSTHFGTFLMTYTHWRETEPNNQTPERVELDKADLFSWNDSTCTNKQAYICEKDMKSVDSVVG